MGVGGRVLPGFPLVIFLSGNSFALIPPEVPQNRSYEVFSPVIFLSTGPTYFGEDIVTSSGPACLGYQEVINVRQTLSPSLVPTARLSNYKSVLQTPAGIYYAISHAATTRDFTVEMYENSPAGANAAQAALNSYVASGVVSVGDAYTALTSDSHNAIWVRGAFIQKVQTAANVRHDIALHLGCNSYSAGLAFVNSKHLVRNFLGAVNTIWLDVNPSHPYDVANAVLNNMAGIRNDVGQGYMNARFAVGAVAAQQAYPNVGIEGDNVPPFAANMRLYNAPRVVLEEVNQDKDRNGSYETTLYSYNPYPNYPYGSGAQDYPGAATLSGQISASSGPIQVRLQFSEVMDTTGWGNFVVRLRFSDNTCTSSAISRTLLA